jgi:hypothetical protein
MAGRPENQNAGEGRLMTEHPLQSVSKERRRRAVGLLLAISLAIGCCSSRHLELGFWKFLCKSDSSGSKARCSPLPPWCWLSVWLISCGKFNLPTKQCIFPIRGTRSHNEQWVISNSSLEKILINESCHSTTASKVEPRRRNRGEFHCCCASSYFSLV